MNTAEPVEKQMRRATSVSSVKYVFPSGTLQALVYKPHYWETKFIKFRFSLSILHFPVVRARSGAVAAGININLHRRLFSRRPSSFLTIGSIFPMAN